MKFEYRRETNDETDYRVVFKWVGRNSPEHVRLFRVGWDRPRLTAGEGWLYRQFSIGLKARVFSWAKGTSEWVLVLLGIRAHWRTVFGGRLAD